MSRFRQSYSIIWFCEAGIATHCLLFSCYQFYNGWQPTLRCNTATYYVEVSTRLFGILLYCMCHINTKSIFSFFKYHSYRLKWYFATHLTEWFSYSVIHVSPIWIYCLCHIRWLWSTLKWFKPPNSAQMSEALWSPGDNSHQTRSQRLKICTHMLCNKWQ